MTRSLDELFDYYVGRSRAISRNLDTPCYEWTGFLNEGGYAFVNIRKKSQYLHRWAYELKVGEISERTLNHLCRVDGYSNTRCFNPEHVRPASDAQQAADRDHSLGINSALTHCPRCGEELSGDNLIIRTDGSGGRKCRTCQRRTNNESYARRVSRD